MKFPKHRIIAVILLLTLSSPAHAYIDPGAGSLIVQGLIGSFVAITALGGVYMHRIRQAINRFLGKADDSTATDTTEVEKSE
jgi:hypothetical protein